MGYKKTILGLCASVMLTTSSFADTLGVEAGYASWSSKLTGDIKKGTQSIDFEKDLGFGSNESNSFFWAYIDHPVPFIPNIKIQNTSLSNSASGTMSRSVTFAGKTFTGSTKVDSKFVFDQFDVIPYWRVLDNWANFDIGFNLKNIDGSIKIDAANGVSADEKFDVVLPLLYSKVRFDMPFTGLSVEGEGNYIGYSGNKITDIKFGAVYQYQMFGATIGYRQQNITLEDIDDIYGSIDMKGIYFGAFLHF
jgi:outer membrane protein